MKFTYASLFSGIGGFEQALDKLGGECVFASEHDPKMKTQWAAKAYEVLYGIKPAGDITKIDAKDVPVHDLLVGGFPCFAAGTLITTSEGLKPIEEVRKGDKVLTHTNTFKDVVVPMVKRKKGVYELKVQGSPSTLITEEHPLYAREMYREWNNERRSYERKWSEPKWVEAKDLEKGKHFVGMSENKNGDNPLNITYEEAWLIGRYVADGYIRNGKRSGRENSYNNQVIYCVGKDKIDEFTRKITSYNVGVSEERTVYKCRIINKRFMDLCKMAGRGSENKRVPSFIIDLPNDILESFLDGYLSGDGNVRDGNYQATSVSKELIYGLGQVVQKLYNTPYSIQYFERPKTTIIEGRTVNQRDTWMIRFRKENRKQQNGVYLDGMLWMPVRSLDYIEEFDDYVYNLEVEGDNSYVANNLTVHNCQAFSVAGKRKGFEDTRGTLFFEIARIAKEKQPKALLLENVKGLVNHDKGRTLDIMIRTLNEIGYVVDFNVLNSKYFGVPQNRERIFIIAVREDLHGHEDWDEETTKGHTVVPKGKRRLMKYGWLKSFNFDFPTQEKVTTRLRDILETSVDEKYYLDEEKTAKLIAKLEEKDKTVGTVGHHPFLKKYEFKGYNSEISPSLIATDYKAPKTVLENEPIGEVKQTGYIDKNMQGSRVYDVDGVGATITSQTGGLGGHGVTLISEPQMLGHVDIKGNDSIKRTYSTEGISPTLTSMEGGHRQPKIAEKQEVRPVLSPDTLEASSINQGVVTTQYRIRKLTPLECFRLQGFPDEAHEAVKQAGISDSQRYRQAGNAITVQVVEALGKKLLEMGLF